MFKNTASQKLTVLAFADAGHASLDAGERVTGDAANITAKVEQDDDGTRTAIADTNPTETEDGQYVFDITAAECNGDKLTFYPESSTAGVQVVALPSSVIYTRPPNFPDLGIESDGDLTKVNALNGHTAQTADHTAGIADIPTVAEFNARTLVAASYFDPAADTVANVTLVATTTTNADMRGTDGANTVTPPTVAQMNARTLLAADYFDPAADAVANVTTVGTTTTNADMRGTDSASTHAAADIWSVATRVLTAATNITSTGGTTVPQTGDSFARIGAAGASLTDLGGMSTAMKAEVLVEVNAAIDTAISELGVAAPTATPTLRTGMMLMYMALRNKLVVQTSGTDAIEIYNDAGTKIASKAITDDGSDYTESEMA